jgi:hypothetical protein
MLSKSVSRKASFWIAGLFVLWMGAAAHAEQAPDCPAALADCTPATPDKVDQWESDIVKLVINRLGRLVLAAEKGFNRTTSR